MAYLERLQDEKRGITAKIKELGNVESFNTEQQSEWDALNKRFDDINREMTEEVEARAKREQIQKRLQEIEESEKQSRGGSRIGVDQQARVHADPERQLANVSDQRAIAVQAWLRADRGMDLTEEHRAACKATGIDPSAKEIDLSMNFRYGEPAWCSGGRQMQREFRVGLDVATGGAGQETIPEGFVAELERRMLAFGAVRQVCRVIRTATGNDLPWPTVDDTSNSGALLAEATTIGTSVDPTFSSVTFNAFKYSSKPVFVSQELLEDSAFNLGQEIASMLGERLGRIEASETTTGTGSSRTKGIVTCAGTGVTSAVAAVITADEIINLIHSLDPAYRSMPSVGFMMHDTCLAYIRKLKDATGNYLWQPGFAAGVPDRLLGYPVVINQQVEPLVSNVPVTAKKHILFGAFEKYIIRDVASVRFYRLEERYRDLDQTAFVAFKRMDGDTIQANALKVLLQA